MPAMFVIGVALFLAACGTDAPPREGEVLDRFNRGDNTSDIGLTENSQEWIVPAGVTYGIYNNQAYLSSATVPQPIVVQTARKDGSVRVSLPVISQDCGLAFRYISSASYWWLYHSGSRWKLAKVHNGNIIDVVTFSLITPANYNVLSVTFKDNKITPRVDNATYDNLTGEVTDDFNKIATKHGFGCRVNNTAVRFDNFAVLDG